MLLTSEIQQPFFSQDELVIKLSTFYVYLSDREKLTNIDDISFSGSSRHANNFCEI